MQKKINLISILILLFLASCSDYEPVTYNGNNFFLGVNNFKIVDTTINVWRVGPLRNIEISKGVTATIEFPEFDQENLDKLITDFNVNSWLIRIRKRAYSVNTTLGHIYIPLIIPGTGSDKKYRRNQMKRGAVSLFYAAAAVSKRFENSPCPAFNHDKLIKKAYSESFSPESDQLHSGVMENSYVAALVTEFNYGGNVLNAGESLTGEYEIDVALYNHKTKERITNFVTMKNAIVVSDEARIGIRGCEGYKMPAREDKDEDKMKYFKWAK